MLIQFAGGGSRHTGHRYPSTHPSRFVCYYGRRTGVSSRADAETRCFHRPDIVAARAWAKLPAVTDTSTIVWVTDARICDRVRNAYTSYLRSRDATRSVGGKVYAVKVGDVFVVQDDYQSPDSEYALELTLSKQYKVLASRWS